MNHFNVKNSTGTINKNVMAKSHDDAVKIVAADKYNDRRYSWISTSIPKGKK